MYTYLISATSVVIFVLRHVRRVVNESGRSVTGSDGRIKLTTLATVDVLS